MRRIRGLAVATAITLLALTYPAFGAVPPLAAEGLPTADVSPFTLEESDYKFDTEMKVRHWVMCAKPNNAKALAMARERGAYQAQQMLNVLATKGECGYYEELEVSLQGTLYISRTVYQARAYDALVFVNGKWYKCSLVRNITD